MRQVWQPLLLPILLRPLQRGRYGLVLQDQELWRHPVLVPQHLIRVELYDYRGFRALKSWANQKLRALILPLGE